MNDETDISAYDEGRRQGRAGAEVWENPHAGYSGGVQDFHAWFAGWCAGKREKEEKEKPGALTG